LLSEQQARAIVHVGCRFCIETVAVAFQFFAGDGQWKNRTSTGLGVPPQLRQAKGQREADGRRAGQ